MKGERGGVQKEGLVRVQTRHWRARVGVGLDTHAPGRGPGHWRLATAAAAAAGRARRTRSRTRAGARGPTVRGLFCWGPGGGGRLAARCA